MVEILINLVTALATVGAVLVALSQGHQNQRELILQRLSGFALEDTDDSAMSKFINKSSYDLRIKLTKKILIKNYQADYEKYFSLDNLKREFEKNDSKNEKVTDLSAGEIIYEHLADIVIEEVDFILVGLRVEISTRKSGHNSVKYYVIRRTNGGELKKKSGEEVVAKLHPHDHWVTVFSQSE